MRIQHIKSIAIDTAIVLFLWRDISKTPWLLFRFQTSRLKNVDLNFGFARLK